MFALRLLLLLLQWLRLSAYSAEACWILPLPGAMKPKMKMPGIGMGRHCRRHAAGTTLLQSSFFNPETSTSFATPIFQSRVLGNIRRLRIPGEDSSVLGTSGVPTFVADQGNGAGCNDLVSSIPSSSSTNNKAWGLEGALFGLGPSFVVPNVLNATACEVLIQELEFHNLFGHYHQGKNHHGACQVVVSQQLVDAVAQQLSHYLDIQEVERLRQQTMDAVGERSEEEVRLGFAGLNRRWRIYRYGTRGDETFAPHIDAGFPPSGISEDGNYLEWDCTHGKEDEDEIVSRLTVLMYLNEDFEGGSTNFYQPLSQYRGNDEPRLIASVQPRTGSILVFPQGVGEAAVEYAREHWPLHEGSPLLPGSKRPKYVIRSDALFVTQRIQAQFEVDTEEENLRLFQYDHAVRQTMLPQSGALNSIFLNHVASLYNPHMGVENLGIFLYSFLRLTKQRQVVEIGAGYTSLWILQALKDNDMERERIRQLEEQGASRLLDIQWTIPVDTSRPSSLLCIDNCLHQKETATGALAVAKTLGLDAYMEFLRGDAFEELSQLQAESVDVLWCDFGVGARMQEFIEMGGWASIRPGGFLLCHSTLTNQNTREWLERVRARRPMEETGMDPDSYAELSLLEPHKVFQNSISILQKRSGYSEPIHSQYA